MNLLQVCKLFLVSGLLNGCVTLSFYLEGAGTQYATMPITTEEGALHLQRFKAELGRVSEAESRHGVLHFGDQSLVKTQSIRFYEEQKLVYVVEIRKEQDSMSVGTHSSISLGRTRIFITNSNGERWESMVQEKLGEKSFLDLHIEPPMTISKYGRAQGSDGKLYEPWNIAMGYQFTKMTGQLSYLSFYGAPLFYYNRDDPRISAEEALAVLLSYHLFQSVSNWSFF